MKRLLLLLLPALLVAANPDDFWKLYADHPNMQDFYPFGIYGVGTGNWSQFGHDPRAMNEMCLELSAENGFNIDWAPAFHRHVRTFERDGKPAIELTDFGHWWYREALPAYGFKSMPSLINTFTRAAFKDYQRHDPPLSEEELDAVARQWQYVLGPVGRMVRDYPEAIFAIVSDDEPHKLAPTVAADRLIGAVTGRAVTTCIPSFGASKIFMPHMQPFTGDWYVTGEGGRNNWAIANNLEWMRKNAPDRVFWFIPAASSFGGATATRPGWPDGRVQPVDLRMQFWMAVAGGCKGFFYYNLLYGIDWARGEDNLLSAAYVPNNDLWAELGRLGPMITSAGPLLLSCRPVEPEGIAVECGSVRYAAYSGPAVTVGLLRDIRHDRFVLVPYSNDVSETRTATIALAEPLAGYRIVDLATLEPVTAADGALRVELGPGHGRLLMFAPAADLPEITATVLRHRALRAERLARIALRRVRPDNAGDLEAAARAAAAAGDWPTAIATWDGLRRTADQLFRTSPRTRQLAAAGPVLDQIATVLNDTDDLFRCYARVLELDEGINMIWGIRGHGTKYAAREVGDWMACLNMYLSLRLRYRAGQNMTSSIHNTALTLLDMAKRNQQQLRELIDRRLAEVRRPVDVAVVTGNRITIEYFANVVWLDERFQVRWFAPDAAGDLVDMEGRPFVPADFQVIAIDQLRYVAAPAEGQPVDPVEVLLPALVAPDMVAAMREYLQAGGGLVLQGIAGLYALPLGLETNLPDRVHENGWYPRPFAVGLAAAPGCAAHPLFTGLDAAGYLSNGSNPGLNFVSECAWEKGRPTGTVVAIEFDEMFGAIPEYAGVVEYAPGKGRAIVLGSRALDLTSNNAGPVHRNEGRRRNRQMLENAITYVAGADFFTPAPVTGADAPRAERYVLPEPDWRFRLDPADAGTAGKWFAKDFDDTAWDMIVAGINWEAQGYDFDGLAWYRRAVPLANKPGKRTILHFGAVDEQAVVWIDGKEVGRHEEGQDGWDKPFSFDVTDFLTEAEADHLVAVRVQDLMAAGGIWRPVWVTWE